MSATVIHDLQHAQDAVDRNSDVPPAVLLNNPYKNWSDEARAYLTNLVTPAPVGEVVRQASVAVAEIVAPTAAIAVMEPEPDTAPQAVDAEDSTDIDQEIKDTARQLVTTTDGVFKAIVDGLLNEFDGITSEEAKDLAGQALEDARWDEQQYAEKMGQAASEARDKELAAKAEADHLFLENYGYKHRKRIKVSPEDEEKAAKLYREKGEQATAGPKTRLRRMSFSKKKKLYWLWQHRIPFGAMATIAGDPDEGKSLLSLYIAACVSRGTRLYGNTEDTEPGEVLLLSAEDDPEITLRPRLEAVNADLDKIHLLESVMLTDGAGKEGSERLAQLDTDIKAIEKILDDNPEIRLIIIDPISSFLGAANINREQEVRRVLQPLQKRARESGLAVIMIAHFNKSSEARSATDRVGGAKAIVGMGRAAWTCVREPQKEQQAGEPMTIQDSDRRLFLKLKGNLAPSKIGGLIYTIKARAIEVEDRYGRPTMEDQPYIEWLGETKSTAQEIVIDRQDTPKVNKIDPVKTWLQSHIEAAGGYAPADIITATAVERGYSISTLHRAKQQLKLRQGWVGRESHWALPNVDIPTPPPMEKP